MDGLEVLRLHTEAINAGQPLKSESNIAYEVLDKLRVVVGALGNVLLIRPLEQPPELAGCSLFGHANKRLWAQFGIQPGSDGDMGALVVGAIVGDILEQGQRLVTGTTIFNKTSDCSN